MQEPADPVAPAAEPEEAPAAAAPPEEAAPVAPLAETATEDALSDEGIAVAWIDHETILSLTADPYDRRRPALHMAGRTFAHVAESADGAWIYRVDR